MLYHGRYCLTTSTPTQQTVLLAVSAFAEHDDHDIDIRMRNKTEICRPGMLRPELAATCWSAILEVPACVFEMIEVFEGGSIFKLGRACCHAFLDLTEDCKIEVFQHSKLFAHTHKFCVSLIDGGGTDIHSPPPHSL
ncbi:hypothetical protein LINGRAHAP2_LOCUS7094 [Linum grandiflorum]